MSEVLSDIENLPASGGAIITSELEDCDTSKQAFQHNFDKYFTKYPEETIKFYVVDFSKETPGTDGNRKIKII